MGEHKEAPAPATDRLFWFLLREHRGAGADNMRRTVLRRPKRSMPVLFFAACVAAVAAHESGVAPGAKTETSAGDDWLVDSTLRLVLESPVGAAAWTVTFPVHSFIKKRSRQLCETEEALAFFEHSQKRCHDQLVRLALENGSYERQEKIPSSLFDIRKAACYPSCSEEEIQLVTSSITELEEFNRFEGRTRTVMVASAQHLHGGGLMYHTKYSDLLRTLFPGRRFRRAFEWCAGPGYIGFWLLAEGLIDHLVLADVNPMSTRLARETVAVNELQVRNAGLSRFGL